jgi:hypothetical protein
MYFPGVCPAPGSGREPEIYEVHVMEISHKTRSSQGLVVVPLSLAVSQVSVTWQSSLLSKEENPVKYAPAKNSCSRVKISSGGIRLSGIWRSKEGQHSGESYFPKKVMISSLVNR